VPTAEDLLDISFVNQNAGWIVGTMGTILHTTNAGATWVSEISPDTVLPLYGVYALSDSDCWAVGADTLIIRTTNGGETWQRMVPNVSFGAPWVATTISFSGRDTGWIAGFYRTISPDSFFVLKTTDRGNTWLKLYIQDNGCVPFALDVLDESHAWLSCNHNLLRTSDGSNWQVITSLSGDDLLRDVAFVTPKIGWITLYSDPATSVIYRTIDSGKSWTSQLTFCLTGADIYTSFVDTMRGWVVQYSCVTDAIEIWGTDDGGMDWTNQLQYPYSPTHQFDKRILFVDSLNGWMIGEGGMVFHTVNGGLTVVDEHSDPLPSGTVLSQNYPNPFNSATVISYALSAQSDIVLEIYDILGRRVMRVAQPGQAPGNHKMQIDFDDLPSIPKSSLPSGVYFYKLVSNSRSITKSMLYIR
jgi:photosystem II stability/assembly factor-like uncharacterized protein